MARPPIGLADALADSSITWAALSWVTRFGPRGHVTARHQAVLGIQRQEGDRQVTLQELLLVDGEGGLAVGHACRKPADRSKLAIITSVAAKRLGCGDGGFSDSWRPGPGGPCRPRVGFQRGADLGLHLVGSLAVGTTVTGWPKPSQSRRSAGPD